VCVCVCVCVCLCVGHTAEPIEMPFWGPIDVGSRNHLLDESRDPQP